MSDAADRRRVKEMAHEQCCDRDFKKINYLGAGEIAQALVLC